MGAKWVSQWVKAKHNSNKNGIFMRINEKHQIFFDEVSAQQIAADYGTPVYVYEENRIRENYQRAKKAFAKYYDNVKLYYAIKACNNLAIASILKSEGAGIDAASVHEIKLANAIGITGENIMFSGNFVSDEDLKEALASGVVINLDDDTSLDRLLKFGTPKVLSFRVNPGYGKSDVGEAVTNAGPEAKFGLHPDQVMGAYRAAKAAGIKRFGAHMMPGSCVREPEYFEHITKLLMDILIKVRDELDITFEFVDLGGGLGIPYEEGEEALDMDKTAELIISVFKEKLGGGEQKLPRLIMEPARYFVGDAGTLLGRIHSIKTGYREIWGTDIGMNILARPVLYDAHHNLFIDGKSAEGGREVAICGQICENTDMWVKDRMMPEDGAVGDLIAVENAGAYGFSMSYPYNGRLRPAEVLVKGSEHYLIRQAEEVEDLMRDVTIPSHLK